MDSSLDSPKVARLSRTSRQAPVHDQWDDCPTPLWNTIERIHQNELRLRRATPPLDFSLPSRKLKGSSHLANQVGKYSNRSGNGRDYSRTPQQGSPCGSGIVFARFPNYRDKKEYQSHLRELNQPSPNLFLTSFSAQPVREPRCHRRTWERVEM